MQPAKPQSIGRRISQRIESFLMTSLVPKHRVGRFFAHVFRIPLLFQRIGLEILIPSWILILTTTGRRSGLSRKTPLGFSYNPESGAYIVMSGWEGRTDWYRNAMANPKVMIWARGEQFTAVAEPASDLEAATILEEIIELNPKAIQMLSRWSDVELDGSQMSLLAAAAHFPVLLLKPSADLVVTA